MSAKNGTRMAAATEPLLVLWCWLEGSWPELTGSGKEGRVQLRSASSCSHRDRATGGFINKGRLHKKQKVFPFHWEAADTFQRF